MGLSINQLLSTCTNPSYIKLTAAVSGALFLGYCVYFDKKRRSHPNYRKNLREKRAKAKLEHVNKKQINVPNIKDHEAMQKFFLQEVTKGEELLAMGDFEAGIEHLSNAVAVCGQQKQLLSVLQQTLPPQIFMLLVEKLPEAQKKIFASVDFATTSLADDDVD